MVATTIPMKRQWLRGQKEINKKLMNKIDRANFK
jgi:hypothetical protein